MKRVVKEDLSNLSFDPNSKDKVKIGNKNTKIELKNKIQKTTIKTFLSKYKIVIIGSIISIIIFAVLIYFIFTYISKKKENNKDENDEGNNISQPTLVDSSDTEYYKSGELIKKEFKILTKTGDLRHISIVQKTQEETKMNEEIITNKITRKTNYDIYFESEEDASEENKKYYSKMYKGVVSIRSECTIADDDDCQPQPLVDLTSKSRNIRLLDSQDFKDIPIPLCVFNITDNNIITTMTCPESLQDNKRNEIILDLYFFRPPAAERPDKEGDNITLTIKQENELTKIHETNGGFCNIYNNIGSKCTTEMNTTLDKKGNLLFYEEQAITIINYDDKNSYNKNKITNLIDNSKIIQNKHIQNYENSLNNLLPLINPYMKEEIQFTQKEYDDLYNVIKNKKNQKSSSSTQSYVPKKTRNTFRNLNHNTNEYQHIKQTDLFSNKITPVQINLNFKINPGINSKVMGAYGSIIFDNKEIIYSSIEEFSIIQELIEKLSTLSKAGNLLASKLYDKIYNKLEMITNEITIQIKSLDELLMYYDINKVFNSTLIEYSYKKLTSETLEISNQLVNSLSSVYYNIRSGNVKYYLDILSDNIYNYIDELHDLIRIMLDNLATLSNILVTKNNTYTEITNYYLNNTSSSYVNIIQKIKIILDTYFIKEYEKINPKIQEIIYLLELNSNDTLKDELNSLKDLYTNIKEKIFTINSITEQGYQTVLSNLENSYNYPSDIIEKIKDYIKEIMNLKENGYFTSNEDINNFNNSFMNIISEAKEVAKKLDNVHIIDKVFDNIMIKFREGYIYTVKFMEEIKSSNFTFEEDVLNTSLFTKNEKNKIESELKRLCDDIINVIKREKNVYILKIKNYFKKFIDDNLEDLNDIISDLNIILSEEAIFNIAQSFEISLNFSLEKLINITYGNMNLTKQYFDLYYKLLNSDSELKKLLKNYSLDNHTIYEYAYSQLIYQMIELDEIRGKMRTTGYLTKYNSFMANFNYSEEYLSNQLYFDFINEYRELFTKIKEELQSIINNKLAEKYSNFSEVVFFEKHVRKIDKIKAKIDKYFSTDIFNKKYLKIINENINSNINLIKSMKNYINDKHNFIKNFSSYEDNLNDICIKFKRKVCYGCDNCVTYTFFDDTFCFILSPYEYNYLSIRKITFDSIQNFSEYNLIFNNINDKVIERTDRYNYILKNFELNISVLKQETLNENITVNYLEALNNWIILVLNQKYENVILTSTYNYYKQNLNSKLENMLSDIFDKWKNIYRNLIDDIMDNVNDLEYTMFEFSTMADIYKTIIETDETENFFNSIILFEKSELNYTISHYYNYLLKLIDKYYKYIIQKIESDGNDFNDIIEDKKIEIKNKFENFSQLIINSELNYLSQKNQLAILELNETDFFKVKHILKNNIKNTSGSLQELIDEIYFIEYFLDDGNEYTLVMRYYLENQELGKLIEQYYEPIDKGEFIYLNLGKFRDIILENWIFESEDFVNILNNALYETNKEIKKELNIKLEEYTELIEYELNDFFDKIDNIISNLFKTQFEDITSSQKNKINNIISELLNEFNTKMISEAERIENNAGAYQLNKGNIENYITNYKKNIISRINICVFEELDKFHESIYTSVYTNFVTNKIRSYLNQAKLIISFFNLGEYKLLNSSFNIGEIIITLVEDIIDNYNIMVKKKINNKYTEYYEKIKSSINLESINSTIDKNVDNIYQTVLLPKLNNENNCNSTECPIFDFTQEINDGIDDLINEEKNIIRNEISLKKGDNFDINIDINIDISISGINILKQIYESLEAFLSFENQEQTSRINEFIQNKIISNLDDFLNNVVPVYGNSFFERIIDYNINFKIANLYENLKYGISKTLLYYHILRVKNNNIRDLPFDLKIRLYSLNDFDSTVVNKVEEIKILAEQKLSELIIDLKYEVKKAYNQFLKEDQTIKNSFNPNILEKIDFNLEKIMPYLEKKYQNALEKYLKEKFINIFSEVIDEKTANIIKIFLEEKNKLIQRLDDLFSSVEDKDLNEVNKKINITLGSIKNYNRFLPSFQISEEVKYFLMNYSENNLLPIFKKFNFDLNKVLEEKIKKEINTNSLEIENVDPSPFKAKAKEIHDDFCNNYINYIKTGIIEYGDTESNYKNNLDRIIEQKQNQGNSRRRLDGYSSEEEIIEETLKRIESKYVEESLEQIVNKTRNVKQYIETLYAFTENEKIIKNYKNNLNIEYKKIKETIVLNKYSDEIDKFLKEKLSNLTNILTDYYDTLNSTFSYLKYKIIDSINNTKNALNNITEITKNTLNGRYQKISDSTNPLNKTRTNYIERYKEDLKYVQKSENMLTNVTAYIKDLTEYGEFKLEFTLEGDKFKVPKIKAKIVDKTIPKKVTINVLSEYGFCYYEGYSFEIEFKDASFTTTIEYDIKSSYINITSYKDIQKYEYTQKHVVREGEMSTEEINVDNYIKIVKCVNIQAKTNKNVKVEVPTKNEKESKIIDGI